MFSSFTVCLGIRFVGFRVRCVRWVFGGGVSIGVGVICLFRVMLLLMLMLVLILLAILVLVVPRQTRLNHSNIQLIITGNHKHILTFLYTQIMPTLIFNKTRIQCIRRLIDWDVLV